MGTFEAGRVRGKMPSLGALCFVFRVSSFALTGMLGNEKCSNIIALINKD